jgi:uncharacterized membrane protein
MRERGALPPVLLATVVFLILAVAGLLLLARDQTILGDALSLGAIVGAVLFGRWYSRKYFT